MGTELSIEKTLSVSADTFMADRFMVDTLKDTSVGTEFSVEDTFMVKDSSVADTFMADSSLVDISSNLWLKTQQTHDWVTILQQTNPGGHTHHATH